MTRVLESIIDAIMKHDEKHPLHGVGCSCHDGHAATIRRLIQSKGMSEKSVRNLMIVFGYVLRS